MAAKTAKQADTRERILLAAERMFAEYGFDGVSLRQLGAEAGAAIALINYHFGTKEMLYRAVFENRIAPLSEQRRAALDAALTASDPPKLEAVLDALARPWIELHTTGQAQDYTRLVAREVHDPREAERGIVRDLLDPVARDFIAAMEQALPDRPPADLHWGYLFFMSTLQVLLSNPQRIERLFGDLIEDSSADALVTRLVDFVSAALTKGTDASRPTYSEPGG